VGGVLGEHGLVAVRTGVLGGMLRRRSELLGRRTGVLAIEGSMLRVFGMRSGAGLVLPVARLVGSVAPAVPGFFRPVQPQGGILLAVLAFLVFPLLETLRARRPSRLISGPPCRISVLRS
jgi:hypothetical protein